MPGISKKAEESAAEGGELLFLSSPVAEGYGFVHAYCYSSRNSLMVGATLVVTAVWGNRSRREAAAAKQFWVGVQQI